MRTLSELNSFADQSFELTDGRPARAVFDRPRPQPQVLEFDDGDFTVTVAVGTEIIEIINYSTANVRYLLKVKSAVATPLTASTITWASLPAGVTAVESPAEIYTVSALTSVSDWNTVKNPTWTLPSDFASAYQWFYLEGSIVYFDQDLDRDVTVTWDIYDINYYPFLQINTAFTITPTVAKTVSPSVSMSVVGATLELSTRVRFAASLMTSSGTLFCETAPIKEPELPVFTAAFTQPNTVPNKFAGFTRNYPVTANLSAVVGYLKFYASQMTAVAGPIGPGGVAYLEGNGFALGTGFGSWPQGFPGIVRIKESPVDVNAAAQLSSVGDDGRIRFGQAALTATVSLSTEGKQIIGIVSDQNPFASLSADIVRTTIASADILAQSNLSVIIGAIKPFTVNLTSTFTRSITANYKVASNFIDLDATVSQSTKGNFKVLNYAALISTAVLQSANDFILEINTTRITGTTVQIEFQSYNNGYFLVPSPGSFQVFWGDGTNSTFTGAGIRTKTYATNGVYRIRVRGDVKSITDITQNVATSIVSFGEIGLERIGTLFRGNYNSIRVPQSLPSSIKALSLFQSATAFNSNQDIQYWDTSNVQDFYEMFSRASIFNQNISSWDTSNAIVMSYMFEDAVEFNQPINSWDVSNVKRFENMFRGRSYSSTVNNKFNQSLSTWDTSSAVTMSNMFAFCVFNQSIDHFNVSNVEIFTNMFNSSSYNQPLNSWTLNTTSPINMSFMFSSSQINQPLNNWDTSNVTNMDSMFRFSTFDQDISGWCVEQIPTKPTDFDLGTSASWTTAEKPNWGAPC